MKIQGAVVVSLRSVCAQALVSYIKVFITNFLFCDEQDTVRRAILFVEKSCLRW